MSEEVLFEMRGITKEFPGIRALDDVSFDCRRGEVHALVGENGAGKSTLMKVLSGVYQAEAGEIYLRGQKVAFSHPLESLQQGVSVIYQEFSLLPDRTVAENIFLGREPSKHGILDRKSMRQATSQVLEMFGGRHSFDANTLVGTLDVAQQQMVEIAKALSLNAQLIVMDEPTAALNDTECELLFGLVDDLRKQGRSIVYITHRMREIRRLADRVTVIKDGKVAARFFDELPDTDSIVQAMVGRALGQFYPDPALPEEVGDIVLTVTAGANKTLRNINLQLRAGEITGFAGVQGAGRIALAMALFGADPLVTGEISINGEPLSVTSPRKAALAGVAMLPGDRKAEGLSLMQSVRDNALLAARAFSPQLGAPSKTRFGGIREIDAALDALDTRAANYDVEIQFLSGGNQQKVIVARWLALTPKVLIFVEPTRGIDVNTKSGIYAQMRKLAREGAAVMMVSSDLPEVLGVSDRVLVMSAGQIVAEFPRGATEADIMLAATESPNALGVA